jgi:PleD family two-component response regulator
LFLSWRAAARIHRGDQLNAIPRVREEGFNGYLVRPVRPMSALTQLFNADSVPQSGSAAPGEPRRTPLKEANASEDISVLLAEDNDINALLARTVLEKSGAQVVHARDGAEAIGKARAALAQGHSFDLVLMDIHMPDMDGVEAARGIRALYADDARPGAGRPPLWR